MTSTTTLPPLPAAHRIPPELFSKIIDQTVLLLHNGIEFDGGDKKTLKRQTGQCSLVCRYWAKHCRAPSFSTIELCSPEDAQYFLKLGETTTIGVRLGGLIRKIIIKLDSKVPYPRPWAYRVVNALPRANFPFVQEYKFEITGVVYQPMPLAARTIFTGLPRDLPIPPIPTYLYLGFLHFAYFAHFVSFLNSLLARGFRQRYLQFSHISWADADTLVPTQVPPAFRGVWRTWRKNTGPLYFVSDVPGWPLIWLLVTTTRPQGALEVHNTPLFVDRAEMCRVAALVHAMLDACTCAICRVESDRSVTMRSSAATDCKVLQLSTCRHALEFYLSASGLLIEARFDLAVYAQTLPRDEETLQFDWDALVGHISAFPGTLQRFCVLIPDVVYDCYEPYVLRHLLSAGLDGGRLVVTSRSTEEHEL